MRVKLAPGGVTVTGPAVLGELADHMASKNDYATAHALRDLCSSVEDVELALSVRVTIGNIEVGVGETEYRYVNEPEGDDT